MGVKYANYHIRTDEKANALTVLKEHLKANNDINPNAMRAIQAFANPEARRMFERFVKLHPNEVCIVLTEKFISVYDETFSFQTINSTVKKISKKIDNSILYVSNYEDDILLMGIVKSGKTLARKHIGQGASIFDIKLLNNISQIHSLKEFDYLRSDLKFELSDDINECEDSIEKELGITVKLTPEEMEETGQLKLIETDSSYKVYQAY